MRRNGRCRSLRTERRNRTTTRCASGPNLCLSSAPLVKRFLSPAYAKLAKYEPPRQRFWFDVAELPQDKEYRIEVRARNCFGKASEPLVSEVWRGKPGLDKAKK